MIAWIPNGITLGNLVLGCCAILLVNENPIASIYCVIGAAVLDFFDGFAARLLKVSSPLGAQLDSLADVVSFGVVPSLWAHAMMPQGNWMQYVPFVIAAGGAYRLARFNLDPNNSSGHFKGLPIPSNAIIWMGIFGYQFETFQDLPPMLIVGASILTTLLMISTTPLLSLKFKGLGWKGQEIIWILLTSSLVVLGSAYFLMDSFFLGLLGVMALYLILSLSYYKKISS
ncbi:MAG: CDP-diacylglycerol--serine O-phosphatidyltransferase [Bacteroidota bacterium]